MAHLTPYRKNGFLTWALVLSPLLLLLVFISLSVHVRLGLGHWPMPMIENYDTAAYSRHESAFMCVALFTVYAAIPLWVAVLCFRAFRISLKTHLLQAAAYVFGWALIALYGFIDPGKFAEWFLD